MAPEGISTLPQAPENAPQSFESALDASKQELAGQYPGEIATYDQGMEELIQQLALPPEELATLKQVLETLLSNEAQYPELRQRLIAEAGVSPEDIPEEFDRGYLTTMLVVVQEAMRRAGGAQPQAEMPMPQGFARGGLADAAESLRQQGRRGDTVLAHINPQEAAMLKAMGGSGTINPATGLPEFFFKAIGNAFKSVGNAVKKVVSSPVGKIIATVALTAALGPAGLGMSTMFAAGLAGTAVSLAGGSDLKSSLIAGVTSGAMAGLAPQISGMLPGSGGFLNAAATGAIMGAGYGAATGQNLRQIGQSALTGGVLAGGISAFKGAGATGRGPEGQGGVFSRETPAPTVDNSAPLMPSEGISTLPTGQTNLTNPNTGLVTEPPGAVPTAPSTQSSLVTEPPLSSTTAGPTGASPAPNAPTDFLGRAKSALFSSDPKNPGFFYNDKGNISIPAVVGTGIGVGYLAGGFNPSSPPPPNLVNSSVTGQTLVDQNPQNYIVGGLPGFNAPKQEPLRSPFVETPRYGSNNNEFRSVPTQAAPMMNTSTASNFNPMAQPFNTNPYLNSIAPVRFAAKGGISDIYPRKTGKIDGPGTGTSDSIPAMLSDGEFVITARAVRGAGNGSRREGAKKLYRMMHALEKKAGGKVNGR